jgi:hypothetical protein
MGLRTFLATESRWTIVTPHFQCISKCSATKDTIEVKKSVLVERLFTLKRYKIDCLKENVRFPATPILETPLKQISLNLPDTAWCPQSTAKHMFWRYNIFSYPKNFNTFKCTDRHVKLVQFQDLPLFYYNPEFKAKFKNHFLRSLNSCSSNLCFQVQKFEAEKFCARLNLKLGFDSIGLTEIFLTKYLKSKGCIQ